MGGTRYYFSPTYTHHRVYRLYIVKCLLSFPFFLSTPLSSTIYYSLASRPTHLRGTEPTFIHACVNTNIVYIRILNKWESKAPLNSQQRESYRKLSNPLPWNFPCSFSFQKKLLWTLINNFKSPYLLFPPKKNKKTDFLLKFFTHKAFE